MFWLDWKLGTGFARYRTVVIHATNWFRKHARRGFDRVDTKRKTQRFLAGVYFRRPDCPAFHAEDKATKRFDEINDDYRNANIETIFYYSVFYPLVDFIGANGIAVVIFAFGYQTLGGLSQPASVKLSESWRRLSSNSLQLFQPIRDLSD
jgi:ATP-binding cassette subfamily B protein